MVLLRELDEVRLLAEAVYGSVPAAGGVVLAREERIRVREVGLRFRGNAPGDVKFAGGRLCEGGFGSIWHGIGF